jgi:hypothetical protein
MDMSAIREIKYLQELRHENITEVWNPASFAAVLIVVAD